MNFEIRSFSFSAQCQASHLESDEFKLFPRRVSLIPLYVTPVTFLRVIQELFNMLIQKIFSQNLTRNMFCTTYSAQTFLRCTVTFKWLSHVPFGAWIEERKRSALFNRNCRTNFPFCDVDDCGGFARVIHIKQVRIELLISASHIDCMGTSMCLSLDT
jgi:hypothetical protein